MFKYFLDKLKPQLKLKIKLKIKLRIILRIILILSIQALALSSCSNEYSNYHRDGSFYDNQISLIKKWSSAWHFDLSKIKSLDLEIGNLPDKITLDRIVNEIKNSKKRVYLEVYILTEKRVINELIDAKKRWEDVEVILEKNVLWSPNINSKTLKTLQDAWISANYASNKNYKYTHSKFFIIDNNFIVGTWNMSHSTFYKNKEFYIFWSDSKNLAILENVFKDDLDLKKSAYCSENIIVSPYCSRLAFEQTLSLAKESVYIYAQEIWDNNLEKILLEKSRQGVKISIILADSKIVKSNSKILEEFKNNKNILIYTPKKYYIHAKAFVIDKKTIYIWSVNFTANSMDNNREVWLVFNSYNLANDLIKQFNIDIGQ